MIPSRPGQLSVRGERVLATPHIAPYLEEHFARRERAWDEARGSDGYIAMCVAENMLMWDWLGPRFSRERSITPDAAAYDVMIGADRFRGSLASFLGRTFLGEHVVAERLAVTNGAGSALEVLFYLLCDPGDGVLVPTPSYTGFWSDLETRDELVIIDVPTTSEDDFALTPQRLDAAVAAAGRPVRALLYTNPNNPLGRVDPPEKVAEVLEWAEANRIHLVLDEIYALSNFSGARFASGAELRPDMSDWLHIVWGFAKDFAVSGFRSGVVYTHNERLHRALDLLGYWTSTSGDTQALLTDILDDDEWVDGFLAESRRRLGDAYARVTAVFDEHGIGYVPGGAGFFFLLDVRPYLDALDWEAEDRLWRSMLEEIDVNLTPGSACRNAEPGFMRVVFSAVSTEAAVIGAERVARFLSCRVG